MPSGCDSRASGYSSGTMPNDDGAIYVAVGHGDRRWRSAHDSERMGKLGFDDREE
jgi:hypothetical protein